MCFNVPKRCIRKISNMDGENYVPNCSVPKKKKESKGCFVESFL